jgi:hypothetical protein
MDDQEVPLGSGSTEYGGGDGVVVSSTSDAQSPAMERREASQCTPPKPVGKNVGFHVPEGSFGGVPSQVSSADDGGVAGATLAGVAADEHGGDEVQHATDSTVVTVDEEKVRKLFPPSPFGGSIG